MLGIYIFELITGTIHILAYTSDGEHMLLYTCLDPAYVTRPHECPRHKSRVDVYTKMGSQLTDEVRIQFGGLAYLKLCLSRIEMIPVDQTGDISQK